MYIEQTNTDEIRTITFQNTSELYQETLETGNWTESHFTAVTTGEVVIPAMEITKTASPESGTMDDPTVVGINQSIFYTIVVTNNAVSEEEGRYIENIKFTDTISDQLDFEISDVTIYGIEARHSGYITDFDVTNGTISFNIKKLRCPYNNEGTITQGESITIVVHALTKPNANGLITNTAYVTGYFDVDLPTEQTIASNTTYHTVNSMPDPTGLSLNEAGYVVVFCAIACAYVISQIRKIKENQA